MQKELIFHFMIAISVLIAKVKCVLTIKTILKEVVAIQAMLKLVHPFKVVNIVQIIVKIRSQTQF